MLEIESLVDCVSNISVGVSIWPFINGRVSLIVLSKHGLLFPISLLLFLFWLWIFSISIVRTSFILFPLRFFISIVKTFNILSSPLRQVSKSRYHWEALEIYKTTNPLVFKFFNSKYIRFRTFYLSFILLSPKYFITFKGNTFKVIYPSCFYMNYEDIIFKFGSELKDNDDLDLRILHSCFHVLDKIWRKRPYYTVRMEYSSGVNGKMEISHFKRPRKPGQWGVWLTFQSHPFPSNIDLENLLPWKEAKLKRFISVQ